MITAAVGNWGGRTQKVSPGSVHKGMGALLGFLRMGGKELGSRCSFGNLGWRRKGRLKDNAWAVKVSKEEVVFPK